MKAFKYGSLQLLLAISVFISSCDDIIVKDIEKDFVTVLAPVDSLNSAAPEVLFWWEYLNGATEYELQVVSPKFDHVLSLPLDTIISGNKIEYGFEPGQYEWSLRGLNNAYSTGYVTGIFEIEEDGNASSLDPPSLQAPIDDFTGALPISLAWAKASETVVEDSLFLFEIDRVTVLVDFPKAISNATYELTPDDFEATSGTYYWAVKSVDSEGNESLQSSKRKITIE